MNPSTAPMSSSRHSSTHDVLQLELPINEDLSSSHITNTTRSMSTEDEVGVSSPDINLPDQLSPTLRSRRHSFIISPGNPSPPSFRQPISESRIASRETHSKLVKRSPKNARTVSPGVIAVEYVDMHSREIRATSDVQIIGDASPSTSSAATKSSPNRRTLSSASPHEQGIEFAPQPPSIISSKISQHSRATSLSYPRSIHRGQTSISKPAPDVVVESRTPSKTPTAAYPDVALDISSNYDSPTTSKHDIIGTRPTAAKHKRGISFDLTSLKQPFLSSPTSPNPQAHQQVNRRRSLRKTQHISETMKSVERQTEPINERQRVMNVKRARKMAQLFGSKPPSALYQITSQDDSDIDESDGLIDSIDERTIGFLDASPRSSSFTLRRSASMASSVDAGLEHNKTVDLKAWRPPTPPFMSRADPDPVSRSTIAFRLRRQRAAKLSHFFGVGYHDLATSVPIPAPQAPQGELLGLQLNPPVTLSPPSSSVEVDVKMNGRSGFWGIVDGRRNMKDADMNVVISKLREMKAK